MAPTERPTILEANQHFQTHGGFFKLDLSLFELTGDKAATLLHGQLTNHIKGLKNSYGNLNLFLTLKGKIITDLWVVREEAHRLVTLVPKLHASLWMDRLKTLAPLSRVEISDLSQEVIFFHLMPKQNSAKQFFRLEKNQGGSVLFDELPLKVFRSDRWGDEGYDVWLSTLNQEDFFSRCQEHQLLKLSPGLVETLRIEQGIPLLGQDFSDKNFPQESRLEQALHFEKGCYLGQEIIARLHYRGHVNKLLQGLVIEGESLLETGTEVFLNDEKKGEITSSAFSPKLGQCLSLAYLPYSLKETSEVFFVGDQKRRAHLVELPLS